MLNLEFALIYIPSERFRIIRVLDNYYTLASNHIDASVSSRKAIREFMWNKLPKSNTTLHKLMDDSWFDEKRDYNREIITPSNIGGHHHE